MLVITIKMHNSNLTNKIVKVYAKTAQQQGKIIHKAYRLPSWTVDWVKVATTSHYHP